MRIFVTGGLGHIGSRLIRELPFSFPEADIIIVDNMMTQRYCSLFGLPTEGRYRFIETDLTRTELAPLFADAYVVIHLAAITDAAGSVDRAEELERNNFASTEKIAETCAQLGVRLITLSSTSVYGTQKTLVDEDCPEEDLRPQSPYAATKLKEERVVQQLARDKGLRAGIYRFGTIFGVSQGMRFHTAVNKFCWQAAMGQPITVWSTAYDQTRPYLDLFDACRAISFIIRKDLFDGRIYNVVTQNATVRQIVDTIREFVPGLEVAFVDNRIMNQLSYEVSCERFVSQGFIFAGDLRRGIAETIALLRQANARVPTRTTRDT